MLRHSPAASKVRIFLPEDPASTDNDGSGGGSKHTGVWMSILKSGHCITVGNDKEFPRPCVARAWRHHGSFQHLFKILLRDRDLFFVFADASSFTDYV